MKFSLFVSIMMALVGVLPAGCTRTSTHTNRAVENHRSGMESQYAATKNKLDELLRSEQESTAQGEVTEPIEVALSEAQSDARVTGPERPRTRPRRIWGRHVPEPVAEEAAAGQVDEAATEAEAESIMREAAADEQLQPPRVVIFSERNSERENARERRRDELAEMEEAREVEGGAEAEAGQESVGATTEGGRHVLAEPLLRPGLIIRLQVNVLGRQELEPTTRRIGPTGEVELPLIGRYRVEGKTLETLRDELAVAYQRYIRTPEVHLEYVYDATDSGTSPWGQVTVLGHVETTGPINLPPSRRMTLSQAIRAAGGFGPNPNLKKIKITRIGEDGRQEETVLDMRDISTNKISDPHLLPGDVIHVRERFW